MENLNNIFSPLKKVIKQIKEGSRSRLYEIDSYLEVLDFIREKCLEYQPSEVIGIAESLLREYKDLSSQIHEIKFYVPSDHFFKSNTKPFRYTKEQAEKLIALSIGQLEAILEDQSEFLNPQGPQFKIGINTKNFAYLLGLFAKRGIIEVPNGQEFFRFISKYFVSKDGKHIGVKSLANNFKRLDDSASGSPEDISKILNDLLYQIQKDK